MSRRNLAPRYLPSTTFKSRLVSKEKFEKIEHLTTSEALRLSGDIYDTLIAELYDEGCRESAKYFLCLKDHEEELYNELFINVRVKENRPMLMALFDNAKAAEQVSKLKQCMSRQACFKLLFEILRTCRTYTEDFEWLIMNLHEIIVHIADTYATDDPLSYETRAKIYCSYALFQGKSTNCFQKAVNYFSKTIELCRGESWRCDIFSEVPDQYSLHELSAMHFTEMLTKYARANLRMDPSYGISLADKAILCVAEVSQLGMIVRLLDALLIKVRFLIETSNYEAALKQLYIATRRMSGNTNKALQKYRCESYIYRGICIKHLGRPENALIKFRQAYVIGRKIGEKRLVGLTLLQLAKLYILDLNNEKLSYQVLMEARNIFTELHDLENKKRAVYIMAKLEAQSFRSDLLQVIRGSQHNFCDRYALRKWKYLSEPFWDRKRHNLQSAHYMQTIGSMYSVPSTIRKIRRAVPTVASNMDSWVAGQQLMNARSTSETSVDTIECLMQESVLYETQSADEDADVKNKRNATKRNMKRKRNSDDDDDDESDDDEDDEYEVKNLNDEREDKQNMA